MVSLDVPAFKIWRLATTGHIFCHGSHGSVTVKVKNACRGERGDLSGQPMDGTTSADPDHDPCLGAGQLCLLTGGIPIA